MSVTQTFTATTKIEAIELARVLRIKGNAAYFELQITGLYLVTSWEYDEIPNSMSGGQAFSGWTAQELLEYAGG